jgi:GNAT superfamily N-acetyltransferase
MGEQPRAVRRHAAGGPLLSYLEGTAGGRRAAYDLRVEGEGEAVLAAAVEAVLADLPGWLVSTAAPLGDRLADRGARVRRRFRAMSRALDTDPPPPAWADADLGPGRRAVPLDRDPRDVLPAWHAAYSRPGHPDGHPGSAEEALTGLLVPLLSGDEGTVLPWSRLAVDAGGRVLAGVVVIDVPELGAVFGDVFRDPDPAAAGVGTGLLRRVIAAAAADGVPALSLAVTDGNPAARVYERLGFRTVESRMTVVVPER